MNKTQAGVCVCGLRNEKVKTEKPPKNERTRLVLKKKAILSVDEKRLSLRSDYRCSEVCLNGR